MSYNFDEITFPSSDGKSTVYAELYTPKTKSSIAIIQISHGMIDHIGRYKNLIEYMCDCGFVVAGNHHIGHGKTAPTKDDLGFFAARGGVDMLIEDLHEMNRYLRREMPTLPLVMLGHSMGSFLSRLYAVKYPHTIKGLIIHGTAGANIMAGPGKLIADIIALFRGKTHRSPLLRALSIGAYEKAFCEDGPHGWLTRDIDEVRDRETDPYTGFDFTVSAYRDLFSMLVAANKKDWYKKYPKGMPTLIMSGECDPVGDFGKGPGQIYKGLLVRGCEDVTLKMYEGARHELFNELCREEVFSDIKEWVNIVANKIKFTF